MEKYDLVVIGTGPAGEKGAVKAAYFGHKVAIIEKETTFGGAEVVTGTLPSKTLKETALFLSGKYEKGLYGIDRSLQHPASVRDFMYRKNYITKSCAEEIHQNLHAHGVAIYKGTASFVDAHTVRVKDTEIWGKYILIATGSYPYHPPHIPFDAKRVHDSDTILHIEAFPRSLCIVGAGVIGCEYVTIFSTMGTKVYLINDKDALLPHVDAEVTEELIKQMRASGVDILFNTSVKEVHVPSQENEPLQIDLQDGNVLTADLFLYAAGRCGHVKELGLEKIGIVPDKRETIHVDSFYRTQVPHIYAVGDVIGFPALASTSMDQGRVAVAHMFSMRDLEHLPEYVPYGIYTIPEISMIGLTEQQAREKNISYMVGKARYADMPRGKIMGAQSGFIKILFDKNSLVVLGVHIIGHIACELIHYGMILVEEKKNLYDVIGTVFNFPTLHDLYKYAAYDGLSMIRGHKVKQ